MIYLTFNYVLKSYASFLIFTGVFAYYDNAPLTFAWVISSDYFYLIYSFSFILSILVTFLFDKLVSNKKIQLFFSDKSTLGILVFIQLLLLELLTIVTNNPDDFEDPNFYSSVVVIFGVNIVLIYLLIRYLTANISYLISYKRWDKVYKKHLNTQLDHYRIYDAQIKNILKLKHDYKKIISAIRILHDLNDTDGLSNILHQAEAEILDIKTDYKKYSNNIIVDAILNDYSNKFKSLNCKHDFLTHIPPNSNLTDWNLIKLFYNILDNALEAITNVPIANRYMIISTKQKNNFQILSFTNSYLDNNQRLNNDLGRGFGKSIISEIIQSSGGFLSTHEKKNDSFCEYTLLVSIPIEQ